MDEAIAAKIGVVGDRDSIMCFKTFGMDVFPVTEAKPDASRKKVEALAQDGYGIIFITEQIARTITDTIDRFNNSPLPAIILIPSVQGSLGVGLKRIRDNVEKAIGINILDT